MVNVILLTGAGFSKNWGGLLATDVTNDLMSRLQGDADLLKLLNEKNFEDALYKLQEDFLLLGKSKNAVMEARLTAFEAAISAVFDSMNKQFQSLPQFEFSNDISRSFRNFSPASTPSSRSTKICCLNCNIIAGGTLPFGTARGGRVERCRDFARCP
jgi:hypothetical protein